MTDFADFAFRLPTATDSPQQRREPFNTTALLVRALADERVRFSASQQKILRRVLLCPVRMLLLALGLLTRADFPLDIAEDVGYERIFRIPLGIPDATHSSEISAREVAPLELAIPSWSVYAVLHHTSLWHSGWSPELQTAVEHVQQCCPMEEDSVSAADVGAVAFLAWLHWLMGDNKRAVQYVSLARQVAPESAVTRLVVALTAPALAQIRAAYAAKHEALCNMSS